MWLSHNRSIEYLSLHFANFGKFDIFHIQRNANLRYMVVRSSNIHPMISIPSLISAISHLDICRLESINFQFCEIGDILAYDFINALNAMPGLNKLVELLLGWNEIARFGCVALCALFKNPECRIQELDLTGNHLDAECMCSLISGFARSTTLKGLDLGTQKLLRATGWQMLMIFLSSHRCSLEWMELADEQFDDDCAASLGDALAVNQILTSLRIASDNRITPSGWREFSNGLSAPSEVLLELALDYCGIDDYSAAAIFQALSNNTSLKKLKISCNFGITSTGWEACFQLLFNSQSALEELVFPYNNIDDNGARILVDVIVSHIGTVRCLDLEANSFITNNGWRAFADALLPTSLSKLNILRIGDHRNVVNNRGNHIDDSVIVGLVAALAKNNSLKEFDLNYVNNASSSLYDLADVLGDETNFDSVCQSNHSLFKFTYRIDTDTDYPDELDTLLEINKNENKSEVVRKKLLMYSMLDKDTVGNVFGPMAEALMPNVIEWIGRDRLGFEAIYYLLQNRPTLLKVST
jgi:Ran GTPase-activating protein (RanGAP) involved in mRNA processing and transport